MGFISQLLFRAIMIKMKIFIKPEFFMQTQIVTVFGTDTNIPVVSEYILEYIPTLQYLKGIWRIQVYTWVYAKNSQAVAKTSFLNVVWIS
jgi:hypothetical protein